MTDDTEYCKIFLPKMAYDGPGMYGRDQFSVPDDEWRGYHFAIDPRLMGTYLVIPKEWAYKALDIEPRKEVRCPFCGELTDGGQKRCTYCRGRL